jgi:hypothetical protein
MVSFTLRPLWCRNRLRYPLHRRLEWVPEQVWAWEQRENCVFLCQRVNTATSSPAADLHYYVIPQKLLLTNRLYVQQTSGIHAPVGERKGCSLSGRSPAPIADSFHVATMARKHSMLNVREINRNNTHTALASVLTYYGWVSLIF